MITNKSLIVASSWSHLYLLSTVYVVQSIARFVSVTNTSLKQILTRVSKGTNRTQLHFVCVLSTAIYNYPPLTPVIAAACAGAL